MSESDYTCSAGVALENGLVETTTTTMKNVIRCSVDEKIAATATAAAIEEKENQNELVSNCQMVERNVAISNSSVPCPSSSSSLDTMEKQVATTTTTSTTMSSTSSAYIMEKQRICLIGAVVEDSETVLAAQSFNVPVLTSDSGLELVRDTEWVTYFVMNEFDGASFDAIRKTKHRIYGPTALKQVAQSDKGLTYVNRPIYNFAMKGVITCFTGIRKKDELTRLVNLIHAMGGSIRKELNSRVTHLICNTSSGEKYQYAMTFRLTVVRAKWVEEAWEQRNNPNFFATDADFSKTHKLKPFEGQRICFFGFSPEEHQEMVEVLKSNGGIPTDLDDPECSHVILANSVDHFPEQIGPTSPQLMRLTPQTVTNPITAATAATTTPSNAAAADKFLMPDGMEKLNLNDKNVQTKMNSNQQQVNSIVDTPKKFIKFNSENSDGIVLPGNEENQFLEPANISPILHNIEEEEENDSNDKEMSKRKRDSFDNISIISTDTFAAQFNSAKKPKLIRTGSITRSLRRSMSFVALKNPITNMIRVRRNSIDPNASISSITSMESTFSESIRRPVKEKLMSLKDRITNSGRSKREFCLTPKASKKIINHQPEASNADDDKFILPNEMSMLSCRRLANSTMNTTAAIEAVTSDVTEMPMKDQTDSTNGKQQDNEQKSCDDADSVMVVPTKSINPTATELPEKPDLRNGNTHIVKSDWFWFTIQNGYANEMDYLFCDYLESIANTPGGDRRDSLPPGLNRRKRKRFSILGASGKRRSSVSDAALSVSGSFLDCTSSPSIKHESKDIECSMENTPKGKTQKSMRFNHFMDLYGTESNYVGILHTIVSLFQKPLEDMADTNDALLNKLEVQAIFNNFSPIHEVHLDMLKRFGELQSNWSENCLIGKIILDHREALIKAYPPYVNFFEQMKEMLLQCDAQNPRFHAFLKINQAKPECGRQTLQDLMIRPVQRLPSMSLLISDILKHTPKSNPDYKELEHALKAIKEVMTHINEDKRKTEGRLALFDIFNDIDHCPPDLVSSHRSFISKCEVTELTNCLSGRDDPLMIFLFTDYIEICKIRKSRGFNNIKSPTGTMNALNTTTRAHPNQSKAYKHIRLIPLNAIPCVYDISDSARAFAITIKDKLYCFNITDECDKIVYLKSFCKQLAENACRADAEQFLHSYESHELGIDISDINFGTLKKVYNYARTRLKVTRAFSFKNTPLKLKRAISTTSPLYASTNSLTPM